VDTIVRVAVSTGKNGPDRTLTLIGAEWSDRKMPTPDEWERIRVLAADIQREIEHPRERGRKPIAEAQRNFYAREVALAMNDHGLTFSRACAALAQRVRAAGLEGGDARTIQRCCRDAARTTYPEYIELFDKRAR
jgi:hypothetical protein